MKELFYNQNNSTKDVMFFAKTLKKTIILCFFNRKKRRIRILCFLIGQINIIRILCFFNTKKYEYYAFQLVKKKNKNIMLFKSEKLEE